MNSLARIRMVATSNTLPAAKSMIAEAGSWCEVVCRDGTLSSVWRGRSADTDVRGASDKDEVLGRVKTEGSGNKVLETAEIGE